MPHQLVLDEPTLTLHEPEDDLDWVDDDDEDDDEEVDFSNEEN